MLQPIYISGYIELYRLEIPITRTQIIFVRL